jgi:uncharacterized protein (DUF433 family)
MAEFNLFAFRILNFKKNEKEYWNSIVHDELKQGRARFGFDVQDEIDLKKLRTKVRTKWKDMSPPDREFWSRAGFLLELKKGDCLMYVNMPREGKSSLVRVEGDYEFREPWDNIEIRQSFRHLIPCAYLGEFNHHEIDEMGVIGAVNTSRGWSRIAVTDEISDFIAKAEVNISTSEPIRSPKLIIRSSDLMYDIRNNLTNEQIAHKYGLSETGLQQIFEKFVRTRSVKREELVGRVHLEAKSQSLSTIRQVRREYLEIALPVISKAENRTGIVQDLSTKGLCIAGIESAVAETKHLTVLCDHLSSIGPFQFYAKCQWVKRKGAKQYYRAGYEITKIDDENEQRLGDFVRFISCTDCKSSHYVGAEGRNRKISGKTFANQIRAGMTDLELMKEYSISSIKQLERVLKTLINANLFDESELAARFPHINL